MNNDNNELNNQNNQVKQNVDKHKIYNKLTINILFTIVMICFVIFYAAEGIIHIPGLSTDNTSENNIKNELLELSNKYVDAAKKMWNDDLIICQDAVNQAEFKKPSLLSKVDQYSGNAFYYVFINSNDKSEVDLKVKSTKSVAGWIRINIAENKWYIALSDGKNYILDKGNQKGTEFGTDVSKLTVNDVNTTGNGSNYQYMNGNIYGSSTDGNGWGIGDYKIINDGDETNNGIYMSNGPKTGGYTPYCKNIK